MKKYILKNFDRFSVWVLSAGLVILPLVVMSSYGASFDVGKKFVITIAVFLAAFFWLIGRLQEHKITVPKNLILAGGGLVCLSFLLSALLSSPILPSLVGLGHEQLTFLSIFVYFLMVFLIGTLFQAKSRLVNFYLGLMGSAVVVFAFQAVRLLWGAVLTSPFPIDLFSNGAVNLIGKWNDLGVFFGLIAVLALAFKELLPLGSSRLAKSFGTIVLGISLVAVAVVNFYTVWLLIGLSSFLILVYSLSFHDRLSAEGGSHRRAIRPALVVFLIALFFIVLVRNGSWISTHINNINQSVGVSSLEVRPSWGGTASILKQTLKTDPIFGVGPNKFVDQWVRYKPAGVNDTMFWNVDFNFGIAIIPTAVVMTGLVGALAILVLVLAVLFYGIRCLFNLRSDKVSRSLSAITFVGLVYLLIISFCYVSDTVVLALTFAFIGLFVAAIHESKNADNWEWSMLKEPRTNFLSLVVLVAVMIVVVAGGYMMVKNFWSTLTFQQATAEFAVNQNVDQAYVLVEKANNLSEEDVYYRALVELNLMQISNLLAKEGQTQEQLLIGLKTIIETAQTNADRAIALNDANYLNWINKARLYESLVPAPLAVPGAYEEAVKHYQLALERNPNNPAVFFSLARLSASQNKRQEAKDYLNKAIDQKGNYTNALFALVQLETEDGDVAGVIKRMEQAVLLSPNDLGLLFQLGFLYYREGNYEGATQALGRAVYINNEYSNARYFLGLALDRLGRSREALDQFLAIEKLNPDNTEVKQIIRNLEAGDSALYQAPEPAPEKRANPPIEEDN